MPTRKDFCRSLLTSASILAWDALTESKQNAQAVTATEKSVIYNLEHTTTYTYQQPVSFGKHQAIFLPNTGHGQRILNASLETNIPAQIHWIMDSLSNNVAEMQFSEQAQQLKIKCRFTLESFGIEPIKEFTIDNRALEIPIQYTPDEWLDLAGFIRPHTFEADGSVAAWSKSFVSSDQDATLPLLLRMMAWIGTNLKYEVREKEGTQTPGETLKIKSGTCRDYAWLMIEGLRLLGVACRFVSGYLYDPALDSRVEKMTNASTHAWLQVYLPGAGWRNYDPTNRITMGFDLIPVAIARHPQQAIPIAGVWFGNPQDYLGMDVRISIHRRSLLKKQS